MEEKTESKPVDWESIEIDYRAGIKTLRQIAEDQGITHGAINKRAKRDGWTRDLKAKIAAAAEAKVSKEAVSREVSKSLLVTEKVVVEANAELQYRIRMEHRRDITRTRGLFISLLEEIETASSSEGQSLITQLSELLNQAGEDEDVDASTRRADRMQRMLSKVLDGPARIDSAKKLTEMLERVVRMEREAFGIQADIDPVSKAVQIIASSLDERI